MKDKQEINTIKDQVYEFIYNFGKLEAMDQIEFGNDIDAFYTTSV